MRSFLKTKDPDANSLMILHGLIDDLDIEQLKYLQLISKQYFLLLKQDQLILCAVNQNFKNFSLNYNDLKYKQLTNIHQAKSSLLFKACKLKQQQKFLDLTCGWGIDSLVIASLGYQVLSYEINPLVGIMVQYAKYYLNLDWQVRIEDCLAINNYHDYDVLYLDPMFQKPAKARLPDKKMQILALLNNENLSVNAMFDIISTKANAKIVIKLPINFPETKPPNYKIKGKSIKWLVYLNKI